MRISRSQLKQMIKEELLKEIEDDEQKLVTIVKQHIEFDIEDKEDLVDFAHRALVRVQQLETLLDQLPEDVRMTYGDLLEPVAEPLRGRLKQYAEKQGIEWKFGGAL